MARGINKHIIVGNLGGDPELRYTAGGDPVVNCRVATSESYKNRSGEMVETTEWHNVVAWGRLAEIMAEYLKKGSLVYLEGKVVHRQYDTDEGETRYITETKVQEMTMLGGGPRDEAQEGAKGKPSRSGRPNGYATETGEAKAKEDDYSFQPDDDLPF